MTDIPFGILCYLQVLLGRSDVSGWGAFLKVVFCPSTSFIPTLLHETNSSLFEQNSVNKHEYLGEYTGELISHREADKRGKIYDRENSSFLFNLNDQVFSLSLPRMLAAPIFKYFSRLYPEVGSVQHLLRFIPLLLCYSLFWMLTEKVTS